MGLRIGADVGGTFTDIVIELADGSYASTKVLTTYQAPELGILDGISQIATEAGIDLSDVEQIIHGTTLATNALIQRSGARTALVTTDGFRDVIETRTESRYEQYDLNIVLPKPLIQRADRYTVTERLNARGEELVAFDETGACELVARIAEAGYESVAVGFIHSYRNPVNEHRFRELLLAELPDIACSISSEVSPQMREFERFNTVCANAYVQPLVRGYLERLATGLSDSGIRVPMHIMLSNGGSCSS
ncbi:MAG: hydantoinase/oxoprolinase family protein, partial [Acidimicrobiaceae bacterium]|nr:hydantoinase/oxoprolinase family protein [Acidimicrobiaceae bacterium]